MCRYFVDCCRALLVATLALLLAVAPVAAQVLTLPQLGVDRQTSPNGPWTLYARGFGGAKAPMGTIDPNAGTWTLLPGAVGGAGLPGAIDYVEPESYGAVSATDNTALFQTAANALCARSPNGGTVHLRGRVYNFAPKQSIAASCAITWLGQRWSEAPMASGTWLHITAGGSTANGGASLFAVGPGQAGETFIGFGVAQDQPAPPTGTGGSWTPTPYPPVFNAFGAAGGMFIRDIMAGPVYDLILSVNSGRTDFCSLYGQVLHSVANLDISYDTTHASCGAMHFWPYWNQSDYVTTWTVQNADVLTLGRVDGGQFPDIFCYAYRSAVRFIASPNAGNSLGAGLGNAIYASRIHFGTIYADSTRLSVWVNGGSQATSILYPNNIAIDNLFAVGYGVGAANPNAAGYTGGPGIQPGSSGVLVDTNGAAEMAIGHLSVEGTGGPAVSLTNTTLPSTLRIESLHQRRSSTSVIYAVTVAGAQQSDISIGTRIDGDINAFSPAGGLALVNMPRLPQYPQPIASSTTYQYGLPQGATFENNADTMVLTGTGTLSGVTVNLPTSPYNGQTARIVSTVAISTFAVTAAQPINGANPATVAANVAVSYTYVSGVGWTRMS